jgi:pimeloyl-ACP methyl ester carboxylesterase
VTLSQRSLERRGDARLSVPGLTVHEARAQAIYRTWFANRDLAELFVPPRSDSLTGTAIAADVWRNGYGWHPIPSALSAPALVLHGTEDALPSRVGKALATVGPQARLTLIPDSGHMPFLAAPETFFPAVESFLPARTLGPAQPQ